MNMLMMSVFMQIAVCSGTQDDRTKLLRQNFFPLVG